MQPVTITLLVVILLFLLVIFLGLQLQVTNAGRELSEIKEQLKQLMDQLTRNQPK